jgi:hypothetical protein
MAALEIRVLGLALLLAGCATVTALPPAGYCAVRGPGVERPEPGCATFVDDLKACESRTAGWSALPMVGGAAWQQASVDCMAARGYTTGPAGFRAKGAP